MAMEYSSDLVMGDYSLKKEKPSSVGPVQTSKRSKQKLCSSVCGK